MTFKLVDHVVFSGKKYDNNTINDSLECTNNIADAH